MACPDATPSHLIVCLLYFLGHLSDEYRGCTLCAHNGVSHSIQIHGTLPLPLFLQYTVVEPLCITSTSVCVGCAHEKVFRS